jgi:hypothetical protein
LFAAWLVQVLRKMEGLTPSERVQFRTNEKARLQELVEREVRVFFLLFPCVKRPGYEIEFTFSIWTKINTLVVDRVPDP